MNLTKLFEIQRILDEKIVKEKGLQGQDLLDKKILALQVELGELAQNWRGFKFWSEDQEPRTWFPNEKDVCKECKGEPIFIENGKIVGQCDNCDGCGVHFHNPLLEEYVDCLHFILSIGLEIQIDLDKIRNFIVPKKMQDVLDQFMWVNYKAINLYKTYRDEGEENTAYDYVNTLNAVIGLGEKLGFTWEQIETAYLEKNKINHERQENGY